jgi:hypothetical protein
MSSTAPITIVKKKQKSAFGMPLSTIGKKQGKGLGGATSPRREGSPGVGSPSTPPRGEALSLIHVSPVGSPTTSPGTSPRSPRSPLSPRGERATSPLPPDVALLDEETFREYVTSRMSVISLMEPSKRHEELERLRSTANAYAAKVLQHEQQREALLKQQKQQEAEAAAAAAAAARAGVRENLGSSRISDTDLQEYERALAENKRYLQLEEEARAAKREAERAAADAAGVSLVEERTAGELVYAEFSEDG